MDSGRIKEIQKQTAYPESVSVMIALKQVWNECERSKKKLIFDFQEYYQNGDYNDEMSFEWNVEKFLTTNK